MIETYVEMGFDVAADDTAESSHEVIDLSWRSASNGIGNTHTIYANLVNSRIDGQQVNEIRSERIFRGETNFLSLRLDLMAAD